MAAGMELNMNGILTPPFNISTIIYYFKKLRISYYMHIIFVHKIFNSRSYSGHAKAHLQISKII